MEKRKWNNQMNTSLLGFGMMRIKTNDGIIDETKALELVDYAYNLGVNYFDTAMPYTNGLNESFTGKALSRYKRDTFYLATKLSLWMIKKKEDLDGLIDKQLFNLKTTYIDNYLLHALNKEKIEKIKEYDILNLITEWKKEGKIKNIGFSFHGDYDAFIELLDMYPWDFVQIQLNYIDVDIQQGLKGYYELEKRNIDVVIMEPIKGGRLASFNKEVEKILYDYSSSSLSSWALRWCGSLKNIKVILSGMNEMDQLKDNINTFTNFKALNENEQRLISQVRDELKTKIEVGCTKCRYCMPCPQGVNIPQAFEIFNEAKMYDSISAWDYNELKNNKEDPSVCIKCNKCVSRCPQNIDIPSQLLRMRKRFE